MKRIMFITVLTSSILLLCGSCQKKLAIDLSPYYGVWANPENPHIEIGTNKHFYIFTMMPNILYCRAAYIRHNNNGSVFAQNIRLMINDNTGEKAAEMGDNNLKITTAKI